MSRLRLPSLLLALALAGCDSQIHMTGAPANPPITVEAAVPAILNATAAGQQVVIDNPQLLPEGVRSATSLEVAIAGAKTTVTRASGGYYTFTIPATAKPQIDQAGNLKVVFVMDDARSQIVTLNTGSPVQFNQPPVQTDPPSTNITRGMAIKLKANTDASTDKYQFTWAYGASAQGPWQTIPGQGKEVEWTPPAAGSFYIKVDSIDRATQQSYSTITPKAAVIVIEADNLVTTNPASGSLERGNPVTLTFNRPAGLQGENLSYAWSASASPQGPWSTISGEGAEVSWLPTNNGTYYVKVDVTNKDTGKISSFITAKTVVTVSEGKPVIQTSQSSVQRGDKVQLSMNIADPGPGPFAWYYSRVGGTGAWTQMSGSAKTVDFIVNEAGSYNFRVDIPSTGGLKSFTTNEPVLNVIEVEPLIQSNPINTTVQPGSSVRIDLKARGIEEDKFRFVWSVTTNPLAGWNTLPFDNSDDQFKKHFSWKTTATTQTGAYYVKVDAYERNGTASYTFTSSGPVLTIQR